MGKPRPWSFFQYVRFRRRWGRDGVLEVLGGPILLTVYDVSEWARVGPLAGRPRTLHAEGRDRTQPMNVPEAVSIGDSTPNEFTH